ncbi:hypothetical protein QQX98_003193 [Neonectria punicea]|uniref:Major facilitator superfamily (MFS) profile domain-containing protein n=1 Tax=Neonectria punicea TaxID=979145 RepID=A0ABR1HF87_9HYPO
MAAIRQTLIYAMIFSSATTIGYDSGYLNGVLGAPDFIALYGKHDAADNSMYLTAYTRSTFSSLLVVGTIVGCIATSFVTQLIGRRGCLVVAATSYAAGVAMQTAGPAAAVFILGRVLLGFALGFISNTVPSYLMECSTAKNRGRFMGVYTLFLTSGNVIACGISLGTSKYTDSRGWRITIGFQLFLAVTIFIGAMICPESPLVLAKRNKYDEARWALATLKNKEQDSKDVNMALEEIRHHLTEQAQHGDVNLMECFRGAELRRTLLGTAMSFFTIATGITFWFGYGTTFFLAAGINNSYLISLILAITNCVSTVPSIYLIERIGRRNSLLWGGAIMAITQILTGVIHSVAPDSSASKNMLVAGAVIFIAAYAATWGMGGRSLRWLMMTEPFSNRLRVPQSAIVFVAYWTVTWLIGFVTPYMVDATAGDLGVNVAYIWLGMGILSILWAYLCVPEFAGLSSLESDLWKIDLLFEQNVPAWRSVAWQKRLRTINSIDISASGSQVVDEIKIEVGGEKGL